MRRELEEERKQVAKMKQSIDIQKGQFELLKQSMALGSAGGDNDSSQLKEELDDVKKEITGKN